MRFSSIQPFTCTHTTTPEGWVSFSARFPLKTIKGGSIFPLAVTVGVTVQCLFFTGSCSDEDALFIDGTARNHIKIGRGLIHVANKLCVKVITASKSLEISMERCNACLQVCWKPLS